jgi:hypothetical protein
VIFELGLIPVQTTTLSIPLPTTAAATTLPAAAASALVGAVSVIAIIPIIAVPLRAIAASAHTGSAAAAGLLRKTSRLVTAECTFASAVAVTIL